jgi:hypothetical protein
MIGVSFSAPTPARTHLVHVTVKDPSANVISHYSGNLLAPGGGAAKLLPVAVNDPAGAWTVTVTDVLTAQTQTTRIEVR